MYNASYNDEDLFYASSADNSSAIIDITLREAKEFNVLLIGEKIELGERITSFKLESLDGNEPVLICEGTSVGYLKATRFQAGAYRRLRLTLEGIAAPVTLRHLALHCYDEDKDDPTNAIIKENLAVSKSAGISFSSDRKEVIINFGGIYPFDTISFLGAFRGNYEIQAFDGSKFYTLDKGYSPDYRVTLKLDKPIEDSYQIKITFDKGFAIEPDFIIC